MERIFGITLKKFLVEQKKRNQFLEEQFILNIFRQLVASLKYCHSKRIIHRDLKPENIMITSDNKTIKLIDFGISKVLSLNSVSATTYCGTMPYMSPEILDQKKYSYSTDIWSMGIILYELVCLEYPFNSMSSILNGNMKPMNRKCNLNIATCVNGMLQVDLSKRLSILQIEKLLDFNIPATVDEAFDFILNNTEECPLFEIAVSILTQGISNIEKEKFLSLSVSKLFCIFQYDNYGQYFNKEKNLFNKL